MTNVDELATAFANLHIPSAHVTVGVANLINSNTQFRSLLINRRLPDHGWSDVQIQHVLYLLSTLDTNNKGGGGDSRWCGVGEREGRVYSSLVASRHFGMSHGIGRSGDIAEPQPKAVGSSILSRITLCLALDAIRRGSGLEKRTAAAHGLLLPTCTGMSIALVLSSLRAVQPHRRVVLWSRMDQKSAFKAISVAGLQCIVVPTRLDGDQVLTDIPILQDLARFHGDNVLAVISTTSCFAPRVRDDVDHVAKLCQEHGIYHVINHAYGLQCEKTNKLLNRACTVGRVDAIVCSTDKNFMVPVGGAIVLSPDKAIIHNVGKSYAGRASASPLVDLFITLLSMGLAGYRALLQQRNALAATFANQLQAVAEKHGERVLACPNNTISFGITLDGLVRPRRSDEDEQAYLQNISSATSSFGAMLFSRCISGTRVVPRGEQKRMGETDFIGFGSSHDAYPHAYLTAACAIGLTEREAADFLKRLDKAFYDFHKKQAKA